MLFFIIQIDCGLTARQASIDAPLETVSSSRDEPLMPVLQHIYWTPHTPQSGKTYCPPTEEIDQTAIDNPAERTERVSPNQKSSSCEKGDH